MSDNEHLFSRGAMGDPRCGQLWRKVWLPTQIWSLRKSVKIYYVDKPADEIVLDLLFFSLEDNYFFLACIDWAIMESITFVNITIDL